jgi:UDP-glucuronate 4-epimerase
MKIGVTGGVGFIGYHLTKSLLSMGYEVVSLDSFNAAYGDGLNHIRAKDLLQNFGHNSERLDLSETTPTAIARVFEDCEFVYHLAAYPGVERGNLHPGEYFKNNVVSFSNMAQAITLLKPAHFFFASSSSIYGSKAGYLIDEDQADGRNLQSYYATTKWMNEIEALSMFDIQEVAHTALRFFTVYGPWGRPDMAYYKFLSQLFASETTYIRGTDGGSRQFTYIDDAVEILVQMIKINPTSNHKALNIASDVAPRKTIDILDILAKETGRTPRLAHVDRPKFDVESTIADLSRLKSMGIKIGATSIEEGLPKFSDWFMKYSLGNFKAL